MIRQVQSLIKGQVLLYQNGVDAVFNPATCEDVALEIRKLTGNKGPDSVIELSGNIKALRQAIGSAAPDTSVTALSWYQGACDYLDFSEEFHHNRVSIKCLQTGGVAPEISHMWNNQRRTDTCLSLLSMLKLDNLITKIPYADVADAYKIIDSNPVEVIQIVLTY